MGECVWRKDKSFFGAPQFINVTYQNGVVNVQAWIRTATGEESDLSDTSQQSVKMSLKGTVDILIAHLLLTESEGAPLPINQEGQEASA
jgi:hypothetical protein